jgi:hypothetical protein
MSDQPVLKKPVWARDAELLTNPAIKPYRLGTAAFWHKRVGGQYDYSYVDQDIVNQRIELHKNDPGPLIMDLENFPVKGEYFDHGTKQLEVAASSWREQVPEKRIGFYDYWYRNYWDPVVYEQERNAWRKNGKYFSIARDRVSTWRYWNERLAVRLGSLVDFVCFSVYNFYPNLKRWRMYADQNLREMQRLFPAHQRVAIIQPNYPAGQPLELEHWNEMVEFLFEHPANDAVAIFNRRQYPGPDGWRDMFRLQSTDVADAEVGLGVDQSGYDPNDFCGCEYVHDYDVVVEEYWDEQ